jgi:Family of unknown function (DUF6790)
MIFLGLWAIALVAAVVHVSFCRRWAKPVQRTRLFLLYQLVIALGVGGLFIFGGHALRPAATAALIGWPPSPNFQFELGGFGLGVAVDASLCPVIKNRF